MQSLAADWANFFVAEVGAAAALSGLLFVAVSINLTRILAIEHLPDRAAETLYVLLGVLVVATFGLIPGQGLTALGFEVVGAGLAVWSICVRSQARVRVEFAHRDEADVHLPALVLRGFTAASACASHPGELPGDGLDHGVRSPGEDAGGDVRSFLEDALEVGA